MANTAIQNSFTFNLNADIVKSTGAAITNADELDYDNMFIEGIASDNSMDVEGEKMSPENFDLSYLLGGAGKINSDHDKNLIIGQVVDAKIIKGNKLWVKGRLLSSSDLARKIYKNAFEMQSDPNSTIRLSWSIEGKATNRDEKNPTTVTGALLTALALTNTPINYKSTYAEVVRKSLNADSRIFEIKTTDFEKSIMASPNISDDFKIDLIKFGLTPDDYVGKFLDLSEQNKELTIDQFHKSLEFQKTFPNMSLKKCLSITNKTSVKAVELSKEYEGNEILPNEVKKGLICLNYFESHENISDEVFKSICTKMGIE